MCVNSVTTFEIYNIYIIYISNKKQKAIKIVGKC